MALAIVVATLGMSDQRSRRAAMKALVVYESLYGNTAAIADAIATSLRAHGHEASAGPVTAIDPVDAAGIDLLVVGGPTHVHGMSRPSTRKAAVDDEKNVYSEPTLEPGLREWLDRVPAGDGGPAAAFDTRIDKPAFLTGSAAKGIGRRLERHGFRLVASPESFFVTTENHLVDGALERAEAWAAQLSERAGRPDPSTTRSTAAVDA
jgi:hypothetical protein